MKDRYTGVAERMRDRYTAVAEVLEIYTKRIASSSVANVPNSVRTADQSVGLWDSY